MPRLTRNATRALRHPAAFTLAVLRQFRANQGLLLAGAVAYYALLSLVPLLILIVLGLTRFFDEAQVLAAVGTSLEFVVPGQAQALVGELRTFLEHRETVGWLLLVLMLFFSSLAFTVLENAMQVVFFHRVKVRRRHFLVSAVMPYLFVLSLAVGLVIVMLVSGALQQLGTRTVIIFGQPQVLEAASSELLYLLGVVGEIFLLTAVYLVMPVGRLSFRHALIGGTAAALLWEATRHFLVWYFATISQIQLVYGSMTMAIAVLLSVEIGAIVLLLGAQVIAEYERIGREPIEQRPAPMKTAAP
ncbi:MAG: YihY/virulence factor BrkB family protein [Burkholderiaceae bacterium]